MKRLTHSTFAAGLSLPGFRRLAGALVLAVSGAVIAQAPPAPPGSQAPITLQGAGPFHRLTLPLTIYGHAAFDDLLNVRVRNATGQAVPFGWLGSAQEKASPPIASTQAPLFAVPATASNASTATDEPMGFKLRPDGSLMLGKVPAGTFSAKPAAQWIIDASKVAGMLVQLRFELAAGSQGMFPFTLDGSDDLRQWRRLGDDEQLVRLQRADETIERLAVELDPVHVRFLRLRWHDPAVAPMLTGVWLDSVQHDAVSSSAMEWSAEVRAVKCGADYCDYPVPRGLPVESLRIALAEPNTLAPVRISAVLPAGDATVRLHARSALYVLRHGRPLSKLHTTWPRELVLVDTVVYRLTQAGGEACSSAVALDGGVYDTLRLRTSGPVGALGAAAPTAFFGARPRTLVFLEQGSAPFSLSWNPAGHTAIEAGGPLPLTQLLPGYQAGKMPAVDGASVALGMAVASAPVAGPLVALAAPPRQKWWLWGVPGAGLLLLGGMAWSLFRNFKRGKSQSL